MPQLTRHQMGSTLLDALRAEGLGVRDLFEGRQEPLSWFFRGVAYDQSELDILESGAVDELHAPSALVELAVDEMALGMANVGLEGTTSYLVHEPEAGETSSAPDRVEPDEVRFSGEALLGVLNIDVAPPPLWLEEREADPETNEELADRLSEMAQEIGSGTDFVEVHIEGAMSSREGWGQLSGGSVQPSGVSVHFSLDIPMAGTGERELGDLFEAGASTAAGAVEGMREVFR